MRQESLSGFLPFVDFLENRLDKPRSDGDFFMMIVGLN